MTTILGYTPSSRLPVKGERIRLPAGTRVKTRAGTEVLRRAQWIRVDHCLNGSDIAVGRLYPDGVRHLYFGSTEDTHRVNELYGTTLLDDLVQYMRHDETDVGDRVRTLYLPGSNPEVRWAGSGGYWKSVDVGELQALRTRAMPPKEDDPMTTTPDPKKFTQAELKQLHDLSDFPVDVRRTMFALADGDGDLFERLYQMVRETHDAAWRRGHEEGGYDERESSDYLNSMGDP